MIYSRTIHRTRFTKGQTNLHQSGSRRKGLNLFLHRAEDILFLLLLFIGIVFFINLRNQVVEEGQKLHNLKNKEMLIIKQIKGLELEVARLKSSERIKKIGRDHLGMRNPLPHEFILKER